MAKLWWERLLRVFRPSRNLASRTFSLGRREPFRARRSRQAEKGPPPPRSTRQPAGPPGAPTARIEHEKVSSRLEDNLRRVREVFNLPRNSDVVVREFRFGNSPAIRAGLVFIEGLTDKNHLHGAVLQPLMVLSRLGRPLPRRERVKMVSEALLPHNQVQEEKELAPLVEGVLAGHTALFVDGEAAGLVVQTRGFEFRAVEQPTAEQVVRGPKHAFTENLRVNTSLVRRSFRCAALVVESWRLGRLTRTETALLYVDGLTNPRLIQETRRRLAAIDVDRILDSGQVEQYLEDAPALLPTVLATERPDRVAAFLADGHVALLVGDSPFALIAPATFETFYHNPEDVYLRWPLGTMLRLIRLAGVFVTLLLPAAYVALINFHQEMIPTELTLAISAAREAVPFPSFVELFFLEAGFELIREAGVRIPSVIGPTIGIVGAVILGQAAVAANLISPVLIIIVAVTALGSFAVPNYSAAMLLRAYRIPFALLGLILGFFGIAAGLYAMALLLCSTKSFGVPYMSPIAPYRGGPPDVVVRGQLTRLSRRPVYLRPLDAISQRRLLRKWDPHSAELERPPSAEPGEGSGPRPPGR
ncbi:MAG: spore germination protein [bacterium]|nr:spore germination protein [bacterium]